MYSINQLRDIVKNELGNLKFDMEPSNLYEPIGYTLSLGGKRLRPVLVLMACDMLGGDIKKAIYPALAIEVFHNFTLIHDDLMDDAPMRRNKETVYRKWNANIAILSGDAMFAKAYEIVAKSEPAILQRILSVFTQTAIEVCEGQQYDMNYETMDNVSIDDYIKMIRLKTAVLIAASLKIGALTADATEETAENLYKFGEKIGIAFQLQDDLLDVFADQDKFGKQLGGDIVTNKKTFLLLKALEQAKGETLVKLKALLANKEIDRDDKVEAVTAIYRELNIEAHTQNLMEQYYQEAITHLDKVCVPAEKKALLRSFADELMVREY